MCLDGLQARLDGTAGPAGDRWKELYESYQQAFGAGAASAALPG